ncbi:hypothetical protein DPEC_G00140860 [Dallia pectoralis]|uniref:Uncharacterized protein n=1 Tax=Dallia pectoralis TaxID=75939 RepID=A0ACC2GML7_DALPE|nr:hypothetical protein DPEC_G00140860 [Dallia pectoralis]
MSCLAYGGGSDGRVRVLVGAAGQCIWRQRSAMLKQPLTRQLGTGLKCDTCLGTRRPYRICMLKATRGSGLGSLDGVSRHHVSTLAPQGPVS